MLKSSARYRPSRDEGGSREQIKVRLARVHFDDDSKRVSHETTSQANVLSEMLPVSRPQR
jgi:hypothetical protein